MDMDVLNKSEHIKNLVDFHAKFMDVQQVKYLHLKMIVIYLGLQNILIH